MKPTKAQRLTVKEMVLLLTGNGDREALEETADNLRKDLEAGAPVNPDGTINPARYGAWLEARLAAAEGGSRG